MLKFMKIIIKILKPIVKILYSLGLLNKENISKFAAEFDIDLEA